MEIGKSQATLTESHEKAAHNFGGWHSCHRKGKIIDWSVIILIE